MIGIDGLCMISAQKSSHCASKLTCVQNFFQSNSEPGLEGKIVERLGSARFLAGEKCGRVSFIKKIVQIQLILVFLSPLQTICNYTSPQKDMKRCQKLSKILFILKSGINTANLFPTLKNSLHPISLARKVGFPLTQNILCIKVHFDIMCSMSKHTKNETEFALQPNYLLFWASPATSFYLDRHTFFLIHQSPFQHFLPLILKSYQKSYIIDELYEV